MLLRTFIPLIDVTFSTPTPDYNIYQEQPDRKPDNLFDHYFFGDGSIALINVLAAL
jgi:hypothetical protein